jgi:hypothetical protein
MFEQFMASLLAQTVTGEFSLTASVLANMSDAPRSLTAVRIALRASNCVQLGEANVASIATIAMTTINSTNVKPRAFAIEGALAGWFRAVMAQFCTGRSV